jgi:hypothetical protein
MTPQARGRLLAARELIVVDLADDVLAALLVALAIEHGPLEEPTCQAPPSTLRLARLLVRRGRQLRGDLARYREAVDAVLAEPPVDDIPF